MLIDDAIEAVRKCVYINNVEFELEQRWCANRNCDRYFWAKVESKQSICCIECWEIQHAKTFKANKHLLPEVVRSRLKKDLRGKKPRNGSSSKQSAKHQARQEAD